MGTHMPAREDTRSHVNESAALCRYQDAPLKKAAYNGHADMVMVCPPRSPASCFLPNSFTPPLPNFHFPLFSSRPLHSSSGSALSGTSLNPVRWLQLLVRGGASVNHRDGAGKIALHHSSEQGQLQSVEAMVDFGAEVSSDVKSEGASAWNVRP